MSSIIKHDDGHSIIINEDVSITICSPLQVPDLSPIVEPAGASVGLDCATQDFYWRQNYRTHPFIKPGVSAEDFATAYTHGWQASSCRHATFNDIFALPAPASDAELHSNRPVVREKFVTTWPNHLED